EPETTPTVTNTKAIQQFEANGRDHEQIHGSNVRSVVSPTPIAAKARPVPTHQRLRLDNRYDLQDRWKPSIHLDEEPAVVVGSLSSTPNPALQDDQLMSEQRILRLKPALRLERRGQHGQNKTKQPDHSASLGDSIRSSTQIRFSVHTVSCVATAEDRRRRARLVRLLTRRIERFLLLIAQAVGSRASGAACPVPLTRRCNRRPTS